MKNLIIIAAKFAATAHNGQVRKYTGEAYINHPARVAMQVMLLQDFTERMVAAAWLHDVVEDCGINPASLHDTFGMRVAHLVSSLTNQSKGLDLPRAKRKQIDRDILRTVPCEAKLIKALDRIDNLNDMSLAPRDFIETYVAESLLIAGIIRDASESLYEKLNRACDELLASTEGKG